MFFRAARRFGRRPRRHPRGPPAPRLARTPRVRRGWGGLSDTPDAGVKGKEGTALGWPRRSPGGRRGGSRSHGAASAPDLIIHPWSDAGRFPGGAHCRHSRSGHWSHARGPTRITRRGRRRVGYGSERDASRMSWQSRGQGHSRMLLRRDLGTIRPERDKRRASRLHTRTAPTARTPLAPSGRESRPASAPGWLCPSRQSGRSGWRYPPSAGRRRTCIPR